MDTINGYSMYTGVEEDISKCFYSQPVNL